MPFRIVTKLSGVQLDALSDIVSSCASHSGTCVMVNVTASPKLSVNSKGYVQLKVPLDPTHPDSDFRTPSKCKNKKVQLHQLVAWLAVKDEAHLHRAAILEGKNEVSHLCHEKACANPDHLTTESSFINKSRSFCEVIVLVNGQAKSICRHNPKCVVTSRVLARAIKLDD
jgi:hypothetical protein